MKFYLGVTHNKCFYNLSRINPEDVNFWQPGGDSNFKVLQTGEQFLFKLRRPGNRIGGGRDNKQLYRQLKRQFGFANLLF